MRYFQSVGTSECDCWWLGGWLELRAKIPVFRGMGGRQGCSEHASGIGKGIYRAFQIQAVSASIPVAQGAADVCGNQPQSD